MTGSPRHPLDDPDRPLRIAMISYYLPSESKIGVGYQVHALANELADRGHHVDVFSPCGPVEGARYGHVHVPLDGSMRTFRFAFAMRRMDLSSYDVLHAHGEDYWMWRRRVPAHVRTLHGSCFEEALRIRGAKEKARMVLLGCTEVLASVVADRTVLISPATRRWTPWVDTVIPNGVDAEAFAPGGTRRAAPTVLFVGTWRGRKRGAELARIFADEVRPRVPDAELRMVTQDAPDELPDGVVALGRLSDAELAEEYRSAWAFCLPSTYEGFGIPYAEAMTAGLPVIATPNVGSRYVTDEGRFGVLAELDGLGDALVGVLTDAGRRAELAEASLARAVEFDLRAVADHYERVYRAEQHARPTKEQTT
ncbi:phosphatidyl-myo-inositol mannosyltransferase [Agromyces rhizosphaerae]|uniref:D-inositol 3-phosphate glycosyltransferase n=1 Tax=Agromyces rhizosphaerae TaxID=88374 RepID=A0A9W6FPD7_9MICO|nr:glycosyltransferase family 4 protein [Agromyces rhizosphaerae]GLI27360.1 phosphatidyl-myo-inositol mannosyltransferase [Agromyces rhizosphaerae]